VFKEQQAVFGDVAFLIAPEDAPHAIRFAGVDDKGTPFADGVGVDTLHSLLLRLLLPDGKTTPLPDLDGRVVHTSAFSNRFGLLGTESFVDRQSSRVYVVQHPPLRQVSASAISQNTPGDYASQEVTLHVPDGGPRRDLRIMPRDWPRHPLEHRTIPPALRFPIEGSVWSGTLFLTKEVHDDVAGGVQFAFYTDAEPLAPSSFSTPMIRRKDQGFFATWGYAANGLPVGTIAGEAMSFGRAATYLRNPMQANEQGVFGDAEVFGSRGEIRRNDTISGTLRVLDESGAQVASGKITPSSFYVPLPGRGRFTSEILFPALAFDDRIGEALLTTHFDTRPGVGIASLPAITSLAVLDGAGRHARRLATNGNASLVFSAADYELGEYRRVVTSATKVAFRRRGATGWVELTPVATGDEETTGEHGFAAGLVYRVDLRNALQLGPGEYELAIDIADEQGNTVRWQLAPAFIVDTAAGPRRRAARK
jgi:hypothetical protein